MQEKIQNQSNQNGASVQRKQPEGNGQHQSKQGKLPTIEAKQRPVQRKGTGNGVVQRKVSDEDKETLLKWTETQLNNKSINQKYHNDVMAYARETADEIGWVTNLEKAKQRMNGANGFAKYENKSYLDNTAEGATYTGDVTAGHVAAIMSQLKKVGIEEVKAKGLKIYVITLPESQKGKNCHNHAFGGLRGTASDFNFETLKGKVDVNGEKENPVSTKALGIPQESKFTVKRYGMAHSAREHFGRIYHKFIGISGLISIPGYDNLGAGAPSKTIEVTSCGVEGENNGVGIITLPKE